MGLSLSQSLINLYNFSVNEPCASQLGRLIFLLELISDADIVSPAQQSHINSVMEDPRNDDLELPVVQVLNIAFEGNRLLHHSKRMAIYSNIYLHLAALIRGLGKLGRGN